MNMKMQLVRGTLALVMFASVGAWAVTHRVVVEKPSARRVAMSESAAAETAERVARRSANEAAAIHELEAASDSRRTPTNVRIVSVTLTP